MKRPPAIFISRNQQTAPSVSRLVSTAIKPMDSSTCLLSKESTRGVIPCKGAVVERKVLIAAQKIYIALSSTLLIRARALKRILSLARDLQFRRQKPGQNSPAHPLNRRRVRDLHR